MNIHHLLVFASIGVTLLVAPIRADEPEKKDPIDIEIDKMMEKNPSTQGMLEASDKGTKLWDAR